MRGSTGVLIVIWLGACTAQGGEAPEEIFETGDELTWEAFLETVYVDAEGMYIVDGDTPIDSDKRLRDYFDNLVAADALTVHRDGGVDVVWGADARRRLTYCVSTSFGDRYETVVAAMAQASADWEAVAGVDFIHADDEDDLCNARADVVFDVRPTRGQPYLSRAFLPHYTRDYRNILVDSSAFDHWLLSLEGIMRHELGHALGFRHEHIRGPYRSSEDCLEGGSWRVVTEYDRESVMHYPKCSGRYTDLTISELDAEGAVLLYPDETTTPPEEGVSREYTDPVPVSLERRQERLYAPVSVLPGTTLVAQISGSGDADLYVRWNASPTTGAWDCRPYRYSSDERCEMQVPEGISTAHVMVRGWAIATYTLEMRWRSPE